jgi:subtilisin family serine protease
MDQDGHGTATSGLIAEVAPGVTVLPIRMVGDPYFLSADQAADAVDVLMQIQQQFGGVRVVNNSWRIWEDSPRLYNAFKKASDNGIAIVSASGNEANNIGTSPVYPASWRFPGGFTVAAVQRPDPIWGNEMWVLSNQSYGSDTVNLAAPGEEIRVPYRGGYALGTGTSMASPFVAGVLALMVGCSVPEDQLYILETARRFVGDGDIHNGQGGQLDAGAAARMCKYGSAEPFHGR